MFELEPGLILWTSVSFGILVLALYFVVMPPLLAMLKQREGGIADSLLAIEAKQKQAEELIKENKRQLSEGRVQAANLITLAQKESDKLKAEVLKKAEQQTALMIEQAKQEIVKERDKLISSLQTETAGLIAAAAGKVLNKMIDEPGHHQLIAESLDQVKNERS